MIRIGSSRATLLMFGWAIKAPFSRCGIEQCRNEKLLWGRHGGWPLAPIVFHIGPIIVFRRAAPLDKESEARFGEIVRLAEEAREELRFEKGDIRRKENWGMIDGKPALLDYGLTPEIERRYYSEKNTYI